MDHPLGKSLPMRKARKMVSKLCIISRVAVTQQGLTSFFEARGVWRQGGSRGPPPLGCAIHIGSPQLQPGAGHEGVGGTRLQVEGGASS